MVASIVLVTRFRRPVWVAVGVIAAFSVHVVIAVTAGSALGLLPDPLVKTAVAILFAVGAVLLLRAAQPPETATVPTDAAPPTTPWAAVIGSFGLIVLAEWGDLTQLATASLAASSGQPVATGIGALLALAVVAGLAVTFGRQLLVHLPLQRVHQVGAIVFASLAVWTLLDLVR
jgi:putative Ca2+/H+ antiporter (TMEM165/GDT1 family)